MAVKEQCEQCRRYLSSCKGDVGADEEYCEQFRKKTYSIYDEIDVPRKMMNVTPKPLLKDFTQKPLVREVKLEDDATIHRVCGRFFLEDVLYIICATGFLGVIYAYMYYAKLMSWGASVPGIAVFLFGLCLFLYGVYAFWTYAYKDANAVFTARVYMAVIMFEGLAIIDSETAIWLFLIVSGIFGLLYLGFSKRVRQLFPPEKRKVPVLDYVFLGIWIALIGFILSAFLLDPPHPKPPPGLEQFEQSTEEYFKTHTINGL